MSEFASSGWLYAQYQKRNETIDPGATSRTSWWLVAARNPERRVRFVSSPDATGDHRVAQGSNRVRPFLATGVPLTVRQALKDVDITKSALVHSAPLYVETSMSNKPASGAENDKYEVPCLILGGGQSARFGEPKGLAQLSGRSLVETALNIANDMTVGPVALNADPYGPYASVDCTILPDERFKDCGPLAGIRTGLLWARSLGAETLLTITLDTPFLTNIVLGRLLDAPAPAVAIQNDQVHAAIGHWRTRDLFALEHVLSQSAFAVRRWLDDLDVQYVPFDETSYAHAFLNINTQADLELARQIASGSAPS